MLQVASETIKVTVQSSGTQGKSTDEVDLKELVGNADVITRLQKIEETINTLSTIIQQTANKKDEKFFWNGLHKNLQSPNVTAALVALIFGWIALWFGGVFAKWQSQKQEERVILEQHKKKELAKEVASELQNSSSHTQL